MFLLISEWLPRLQICRIVLGIVFFFHRYYLSLISVYDLNNITPFTFSTLHLQLWQCMSSVWIVTLGTVFGHQHYVNVNNLRFYWVNFPLGDK